MNEPTSYDVEAALDDCSGSEDDKEEEEEEQGVSSIRT